MPNPPAKLTKAQAMRRFKAAPQAETFRMMWEMQEKLPQLVAEHFKGLKDQVLGDIATEGSKALKELIEEHTPGLVDDAVGKRIGQLKRAQDGHTPERGKDFWTREDKKEIVRAVMSVIRIPKPEKGKDGKNPKAGVDFPTMKQVKEYIDALVSSKTAGLEQGEKITIPDIAKMAGNVEREFDIQEKAGEIARALETLKKGERLDYLALKNRPEQSVKMYDDEPKRIHRGGGDSGAPLPYDLSDQCDGVTKTFDIPLNRRVLGVFGTQFPVAYRQVVDWTRTTQTLTLTDEVGAPEAGQTLWILYVPL